MTPDQNDTKKTEKTEMSLRRKSERRATRTALMFAGVACVLAVASLWFARSPANVRHRPLPSAGGTNVGAVLPERAVRFYDARACRKDQVHIVNNMLTTDPSCTTIVYDETEK